MSLRLVGAAMIILCGTALGIGKSKELCRKIELLETLDRALATMEAEIALCCREVPEIFRALSSERGGELFRSLWERSCQMPAGEAWREWTRELELPEEVLGHISSFGGILGAYDGERQSGEISALRARLCSLRDELKAELKTKGRSYPVLGACMAGIVAMMLV